MGVIRFSEQELKLKGQFTTYRIGKYFNDFDYKILCHRWDDCLTYNEIGNYMMCSKQYVWDRLQKIYSTLERIYVHEKSHLGFTI